MKKQIKNLLSTKDIFLIFSLLLGTKIQAAVMTTRDIYESIDSQYKTSERARLGQEIRKLEEELLALNREVTQLGRKKEQIIELQIQFRHVIYNIKTYERLLTLQKYESEIEGMSLRWQIGMKASKISQKSEAVGFARAVGEDFIEFDGKLSALEKKFESLPPLPTLESSTPFDKFRSRIARLRELDRKSISSLGLPSSLEGVEDLQSRRDLIFVHFTKLYHSLGELVPGFLDEEVKVDENYYAKLVAKLSSSASTVISTTELEERALQTKISGAQSLWSTVKSQREQLEKADEKLADLKLLAFLFEQPLLPGAAREDFDSVAKSLMICPEPTAGERENLPYMGFFYGSKGQDAFLRVGLRPFVPQFSSPEHVVIEVSVGQGQRAATTAAPPLRLTMTEDEFFKTMKTAGTKKTQVNAKEGVKALLSRRGAGTAVHQLGADVRHFCLPPRVAVGDPAVGLSVMNTKLHSFILGQKHTGDDGEVVGTKIRTEEKKSELTRKPLLRIYNTLLDPKSSEGAVTFVDLNLDRFPCYGLLKDKLIELAALRSPDVLNRAFKVLRDFNSTP